MSHTEGKGRTQVHITAPVIRRQALHKQPGSRGGRNDLRNTKARMHRNAIWTIGTRTEEAEEHRLAACSNSSKKAAIGRAIAPLAERIWAKLLPETAKAASAISKEERAGPPTSQ